MRNLRTGSTLVELIMVMLLLILFGAAISVLIYSGGETQARIISEKNAQIDARVALSYVNMYIRQNDEADKIEIKPNAYTGEESILVKTRAEWGGYDTWIFFAEGCLYECLVDPGREPSVGLSFKIAEIDRFGVDLNADGAIVNTIGYTVNDRPEEMSSVIFLRSGE